MILLRDKRHESRQVASEGAYGDGSCFGEDKWSIHTTPIPLVLIRYYKHKAFRIQFHSNSILTFKRNEGNKNRSKHKIFTGLSIQLYS
jgi:hypothetical protein